MIDKDPAWRPTAVFPRSELETLISDERIPHDRRMLYALEFLTGARPSEVSLLTWASYDTETEPLGKLVVAFAYDRRNKKVKSTKTQVTREVPVHPTLAKILAEWKLGGWAAMMGRNPEANDLIIPSREGRHRTASTMLKRFHQDLERVGLRRRRHYDAKRTFISLTRADGARDDVLKRVTHARPKDVFDEYTTFPWSTLCEAVSCLKIGLKEGKVLPLAAVSRLGTGRGTGGIGAASNGLNSPVGPALAIAGKWRGVRDSNPWPPA